MRWQGTPRALRMSHVSRMKSFRLLLALGGLLFSLCLHASPSDNPEERLRELASRQKTILSTAEKDDPNFDQENFRSQVQQLCDAYDILIKDHPKYAPSYVAYGILLGRIDMRREAAMMFLNANRIDHDIPVVKNQLGNYLAEEGKPLEAVSYYLSAIKLEPKEPLYHYQLGTLLFAAREDFLKSGSWTREAVDKAMHEAFRQAMVLAPQTLPYAYRYGESFYDLENPNWDEAFAFWKSLEPKANTGVEKQTIQLHEANVLIKQNKIPEAKSLLDGVNEKVLEAQKQKLIAQLAPAKPN